jgi:hypothetical protein
MPSVITNLRVVRSTGCLDALGAVGKLRTAMPHMGQRDRVGVQWMVDCMAKA